MKLLTSLCLASLFLSLSAAAQQTVSGLIVSHDDGGMSLRNANGEFEIEWNNETAVALEVNTRQLNQLAIDDGDKATPVQIARRKLSELEPAELTRQVNRIVENFLSAKSWNERLKFVRFPQQVAPRMESYYSRNPDGPIPFQMAQNPWKAWPFFANQSSLIITVVMADFQEVPVALEHQLDGTFLVDWESFVGYCEVPWDEMKKNRSSKEFLIRAKVSISDYFNFGFTDDKWDCIKLEAPNGEHLIYAYAELLSPDIIEIKKLLGNMDSTYMTLYVKYPAEAKANNQVLITGGISRGWASSGTPVHRHFRYQVQSSPEKIEFELPRGEITAVVPVKRPDGALIVAQEENWIPEHNLRLYFNETRAAQLPSEDDPRFIGRWDPRTTPRTLEIDHHKYELSLKNGGQSNALLFNALSTTDCKPFVNRATVVGRKQGDMIVADEIHLTPIGDQTALDDPSLPRYLFIGDSISGNYGRSLREALKGKFNLHHPPTNCGPSSKGKANMVEWLGAFEEQGRGWDVISFNFGHWDKEQDKVSYQANLEAVIAELKKTGAKLVWVSTCPVPNGFEEVGELDKDGRAPGGKAGVIGRYLNPWAAEVIARHPAISTCDQWQLVKDNADGIFTEWWAGKDVHFQGEMAKALGEQLAAHILK